MQTATTISEIKKTAEKRQLLRKEALLSEIELLDESTIVYGDDLTLKMSKKAFTDLLKVLGIKSEMVDNFKKTYGEDGSRKFIQSVKNTLSTQSKGSSKIFLATSKESKMIERIYSGNAKKGIGLSTQSFFELIDEVMNTNPNFEVHTYGINHSNVTLNLIDTKSRMPIEGMRDELFNTGLSLTNSYDVGTTFNSFTNRLVCTNGMMSRLDGETVQLKQGFSENEWDNFFQCLDSFKKSNYESAAFKHQVKNAASTMASVQEVKDAANMMQSHSSLGRKDAKETFLNGYQQMEADYYRVGCDLAGMTKKQLQTAPTQIPLWSVINDVTDFASHDYGYDITSMQRTHLMMKAGQMLAKTPDLQNIVTKHPY